LDTQYCESPRLLVILGPTASGKSTLAIQAALQLGGEIINCDSMQMIRFLDIGTAKPDTREKETVPHHLFDIIGPDEYYSAGSYMVDGRRICQEVAGRGMVPIVVGGTGLYLKVLLEGIFEGPQRSQTTRERLLRTAERKGISYLHEMLRKSDPDSAARIQQNDLPRVIRALEVSMLTGKPISELQSEKEALEGFTVLKIGIDVPREYLYDRINRRVESMFQKGLLEEVESVLKMGYLPSAKGFEALGYRYAVAVLRREMTQDQAVELTQRDTRRYAKRQLSWFRKEKDVIWIKGPGETPEAVEATMKLWESVGR
jgi:tRNA dimethylallyltransferase